MSVLTDPTTYPISAAAARQLERPLFGHVIDGEVVASQDGAHDARHRSRHRGAVATAASGSAADVERAVRAAREAFDDGRWRFLAPLEQERRLRKLAGLLAEHADELADLDVIDSGLLRMYAGFIAQFAVDGIEYYSGWPSKLHGSIPSVRASSSCARFASRSASSGPIVPWNGPTAAATFGLFPLCAGNSVVLKPAEQTPMTAVVVAELALEAGIPPGVFNVVQGTGETVGAAVVAHPQVDVISFTGSVATGRSDPGRGGRTRQASVPGAGRKEPVDRLPRRRSRRGRAAVMMGVWGASGQVCTCNTRVLVHESVYDELLERVVEGRAGCESAAASSPTSRWARWSRPPSSSVFSATSRSAATKEPSWCSAASGTASAVTSTSRRSSPRCATTCESRRRRSSVR